MSSGGYVKVASCVQDADTVREFYMENCAGSTPEEQEAKKCPKLLDIGVGHQHCAALCNNMEGCTNWLLTEKENYDDRECWSAHNDAHPNRPEGGT